MFPSPPVLGEWSLPLNTSAILDGPVAVVVVRYAGDEAFDGVERSGNTNMLASKEAVVKSVVVVVVEVVVPKMLGVRCWRERGLEGSFHCDLDGSLHCDLGGSLHWGVGSAVRLRLLAGSGADEMLEEDAMLRLTAPSMG